ncbi:pyridoxamine-phosphate oxidase [Heterostelium album PN500]|uniref:Pyridoxine-5'-phosphate oxidase n=1 Tax=Heterostelium pallidum (strain ATCC 26659 / Pp 5 / PN500) TaxID=670386 RepID=D3BT98_HETP5|nr:pyridoxamine-phosphate oxidase [Heterostelium album PN500]EFA75315.1 pyridoxamine-phosphate oxidase [Heterostelium album PN500]|eukprot:XP_020427449.1 pyridoxamine-phosphate oxidase [Heterostelium album PN500]
MLLFDRCNDYDDDDDDYDNDDDDDNFINLHSILLTLIYLVMQAKNHITRFDKQQLQQQQHSNSSNSNSSNELHHEKTMMSSPLLSSMREDYRLGNLEENSLLESPFKQFDRWFEDEILWKNVSEPNAMHLCTATKDGKPSGRIVLLKYFDEKGFVFFTNYNSRKSKELLENPYAAVTFYWSQRQIRIEGTVEKTSREESDAYFKTRPKQSQIGAWVSEFQSSEVTKHKLTEDTYLLEKKYESSEVPPPEFWGGWRIIPTSFEFWQGKGGRIHDRIKYKRESILNLDAQSIDPISHEFSLKVWRNFKYLTTTPNGREGECPICHHSTNQLSLLLHINGCIKRLSVFVDGLSASDEETLNILSYHSGLQQRSAGSGILTDSSNGNNRVINDVGNDITSDMQNEGDIVVETTILTSDQITFTSTTANDNDVEMNDIHTSTTTTTMTTTTTTNNTNISPDISSVSIGSNNSELLLPMNVNTTTTSNINNNNRNNRPTKNNKLKDSGSRNGTIKKDGDLRAMTPEEVQALAVTMGLSVVDKKKHQIVKEISLLRAQRQLEQQEQQLQLQQQIQPLQAPSISNTPNSLESASSSLFTSLEQPIPMILSLPIEQQSTDNINDNRRRKNVRNNNNNSDNSNNNNGIRNNSLRRNKKNDADVRIISRDPSTMTFSNLLVVKILRHMCTYELWLSKLIFLRSRPLLKKILDLCLLSKSIFRLVSTHILPIVPFELTQRLNTNFLTKIEYPWCPLKSIQYLIYKNYDPKLKFGEILGSLDQVEQLVLPQQITVEQAIPLCSNTPSLRKLTTPRKLLMSQEFLDTLRVNCSHLTSLIINEDSTNYEFNDLMTKNLLNYIARSSVVKVLTDSVFATDIFQQIKTTVKNSLQISYNYRSEAAYTVPNCTKILYLNPHAENAS